MSRENPIPGLVIALIGQGYHKIVWEAGSTLEVTIYAWSLQFKPGSLTELSDNLREEPFGRSEFKSDSPVPYLMSALEEWCLDRKLPTCTWEIKTS